MPLVYIKLEIFLCEMFSLLLTIRSILSFEVFFHRHGLHDVVARVVPSRHRLDVDDGLLQSLVAVEVRQNDATTVRTKDCSGNDPTDCFSRFVFVSSQIIMLF